MRRGATTKADALMILPPFEYEVNAKGIVGLPFEVLGKLVVVEISVA